MKFGLDDDVLVHDLKEENKKILIWKKIKCTYAEHSESVDICSE